MGIVAPSFGLAVGIPVWAAIGGCVVVAALASYGAYRLYRDYHQKENVQA